MSKQEAELERVYTVPLSRAWITARHQRTKRAVRMLREFAEHHMKSSEIKIDTELNEELWKRGITKPPRRITVKMEKDEDGVVTISLPKKSKTTPVAPAESEEETTPSEAEPATEDKTSPAVSAGTPESSATTSPVSPAEKEAPKSQSKKKKSAAARKKTSKKS